MFSIAFYPSQIQITFLISDLTNIVIHRQIRKRRPNQEILFMGNKVMGDGEKDSVGGEQEGTVFLPQEVVSACVSLHSKKAH